MDEVLFTGGLYIKVHGTNWYVAEPSEEVTLNEPLDLPEVSERTFMNTQVPIKNYVRWNG